MTCGDTVTTTNSSSSSSSSSSSANSPSTAAVDHKIVLVDSKRGYILQ